MASIQAPMLHVINRDGFMLGKIEASVGLQTYSGELVRFTEKSVWCKGKSGIVQMYRSSDGRLPCVYKSYAPKSQVIWDDQK